MLDGATAASPRSEAYECALWSVSASPGLALMAEVTADGEDAEAWAWCIEQETGPWNGKPLTAL